MDRLLILKTFSKHYPFDVHEMKRSYHCSVVSATQWGRGLEEIRYRTSLGNLV